MRLLASKPSAQGFGIMKHQIIALAVIVLTFSSCTSQINAVRINSSQGPEATISHSETVKPCINLNTATADQLIPLEGIGEVLAQRIIDYRERHGRFRRKEEIIIIEGISEKKYRAIADRICVD